MSSQYRTLEAAALRGEAQRLFAPSASGNDEFSIAIETLCVQWGYGEPEPVPLWGSGGAPGLAQLVAAFARERGLPIPVPGHDAPGAPPSRDGGTFYFGAGGQLGYRSALSPTPAAAFGEAVEALGVLRAMLAGQGIELVSCGAQPWHGPERIGLQEDGEQGSLWDRSIGSWTEFGATALRATAGIDVHVAFGNAVRTPLRWRAAQLVAPVAAAMFAHAPLSAGAHASCKSVRGRSWGQVDPTRTGVPVAFESDPEGDPLDQYVAFALGARVLGAARADDPMARAAGIEFRRWMEDGIDGTFPDASDWSAHLDTLRPLVRPQGGLTLTAADTQPRAFWSVPLTFFAALLCDDATLASVVDRLDGFAARSRSRWQLAARDGLLDHDLARDAQGLFALAADSLLRRPPGWVSCEMLAAFVAFGEAFALARRSPADDLLEGFLEAGHLDRATLERLEHRWCSAAGTPPRAVAARAG